MNVKWAILAGVSSDRQAEEDKGSIDDQIATCRRTIDQLGGQEVGCYIMDGYSRSGYDSLSDAMRDIPALNEAIEAAAQNKSEQVELAEYFNTFGDSVGGEILPGVTKIGGLWFGFKRTQLEEIQHMTLVILGPFDNNFNALGPEYKFDLDLSERKFEPVPDELK